MSASARSPWLLSARTSILAIFILSTASPVIWNRLPMLCFGRALCCGTMSWARSCLFSDPASAGQHYWDSTFAIEAVLIEGADGLDRQRLAGVLGRLREHRPCRSKNLDGQAGEPLTVSAAFAMAPWSPDTTSYRRAGPAAPLL